MRRTLAAVLLLCIAAPVQARSFLASITVPLAADEYLSGFSIDTWGVGTVAVCHFPAGWRLTVGKDASPDGIIAGQGSHGVTWLNRAHLHQLNRLVLVRLSGPVLRAKIESPGSLLPATFTGTADVGTYGKDSDRELPLDWRNVRLTPATACPPQGMKRPG